MKRSRINAIMREGAELIRARGFTLPPFAEVEEDEAPLHLLVSDYARWLGV